MHGIGVYGQDALGISYTLNELGVAAKMVSVRDLNSRETTPQVLVVTMQRIDGAHAEVQAMRKNRFCGKIIVVTEEKPVDAELIMLYRCGADNCLVRGNDPLLSAIVAAAAIERVDTSARDVYTAGNLKLDHTGRMITIDDKSINFGPTGYGLLCLFMSRPNFLYSREVILEQLRAENHYEADTRMVDVYVGRVRKLMNKHSVRGVSIVTVRSHGYRLDVE